jgi:CRISPR type I-E-associated protein CasB/Cse2
MHPYLTRFVGLGHTNPHRERCVFTVASLMAHTQAEMRVPPASGNLGVSLAQASIQGQIARATTEKSVQRVGRQTAETVCRQVVHVVVPLLSARVPVDFTLLLSDLLIWPSQQPTVRKRWLQSYYLTLPHDIDNR